MQMIFQKMPFFPLLNYSQSILVILEITLVLGVIWLIFKKKSRFHNIKLTESEKEALILAYKPEDLVEGVPNTHYALNPRTVQGKTGRYINLDGIECLNFGSHDYLGFIGNENVEEKVMKCIETYGVGSCGPRGFYGTAIEHVEMEKLIAQFLAAEDSLVYSYGFSTVASAIPTYAKKPDIIFVDEKRNFAIQKGLDASKSTIKYFKHNNMKDLEAILENVRAKDLLNPRKARKSRRYLVIEGIYINSGEICLLPDLVRLSKKYKLRILLDESVSFGVLGKHGRGVTEYFSIPRADIDLIIGSFEYVLASVGGFCVGSRFLIDHQQISSQGFCFSASLPPLLAVAALETLRCIQQNPENLLELNRLCKIMHNKVNESNVINYHFLVSGSQDSPIHMLVLRVDKLQLHQDPDEVIEGVIDFCVHKKVAITRAATLSMADLVLTTASLRITTSIFHKEEQVNYFIQVLEEACKNVFFDYV